MAETTGRCLCGDIRYSFDAAHVLWRGHCHCESCRRATASPMTTFFGVTDGHWNWLEAEPVSYTSSEGVVRQFCGRCGTQLTYRAERFPDETHFYAATLDDPSEFQPEFHTNWQERLAWLHVDDDLLRFPAASAGKIA